MVEADGADGQDEDDDEVDDGDGGSASWVTMERGDGWRLDEALLDKQRKQVAVPQEAFCM